METEAEPNRSSVSVPTYDSFLNPVLEALRSLGGSGTIEEINTKVAELLGLTDEQLQVPTKRRPNLSLVQYRLHWARTYLKSYGLIDNSSRGVWSLTAAGRDIGTVDTRQVVRTVAALTRRSGSRPSSEPAEVEPPLEDEPELDWKEQLLASVLRMSPAGFERLSQLLLRELGFVQVEVTGRSGDGGIDGKGIFRLGVLSFHVSFQSKKYRGMVGPAVVREFRGSMMGRADKGLIITTGAFTKEALREATRDGAAAIDVIDGEQLMERLKELGLGVSTRTQEVVSVDAEWFERV